MKFDKRAFEKLNNPIFNMPIKEIEDALDNNINLLEENTKLKKEYNGLLSELREQENKNRETLLKIDEAQKIVEENIKLKKEYNDLLTEFKEQENENKKILLKIKEAQKIIEENILLKRMNDNYIKMKEEMEKKKKYTNDAVKMLLAFFYRIELGDKLTDDFENNIKKYINLLDEPLKSIMEQLYTITIQYVSIKK
jgi:hypothetical protein